MGAGGRECESNYLDEHGEWVKRRGDVENGMTFDLQRLFGLFQDSKYPYTQLHVNKESTSNFIQVTLIKQPYQSWPLPPKTTFLSSNSETKLTLHV